MTTTPRLWKSLTQVNTSDAPVVPGGTASQAEAQIAPLPDGGYVVVWVDGSGMYNPDGFAIVGQRYDAAGNKVGGEVKISQFSDGDQMVPAVTVLANGNIAVAFVDIFGLDDNLYVRIFDPALNLVRDDVIDRGADQTFEPSITALADGSYIVSYTVPVGNVSPEVTDVVMRKVSATGLVSGELNIDNQTDSQIMSELAALSNGNFVAVYRDEFNGTLNDTDIRYGIFTPAGMQVAGPANVPGAAGLGLETEPDVAALRDGGFVVVWTDPDSSVTDIRASILSNAGVAIVSDILVNTTTAGEQNEASVVALADGGFLVSWEDDNADLVRAMRFDAVGHKIGAEFTVKNGISPAVVESPEAAVLSDGRIAYAIGDFSTGDLDVMTSIWTTGWNAVATGDFNHDGVKDILWQNAAGTTSEWLMSPSGGVAGVPFTPAVPGWSVVAGGDFNGDGTDDILWRNDATGATAEWLMAPTGGVATMLNTLPAAGWNMIGSGDFNGDGTDDLMWQNAVGTTSEWLMSPSGGIAGLPFTPAAPGWQPIASGDFNGDHITDLMWQQPSTGATAEWLMAPTGGVGTMLGAPPAGGWKLIASGDFNGDGTDDVMWQNAATGATSEWLMANGGVASNPFTPAAPGWDVVATGDFNGDAEADLMWQNALTGATAEWLMAPGGGVGAFVATLTM